MRKVIYFVSIFLLFFSCREKTNSKINFDDKKTDTIKKYFENGNLKSELIQIGDSSILKEYYKNGNLLVKGKLFKDKPIGVWKTYNNDASIKRIIQFIRDKEKSILNQQIHFNKDINYKKSVFYQITNDTLTFYSPLDTLSSKLQKNRETKLFTYDNKGVEKETNFKKSIEIKEHSFPMFILEEASIDLDSMVDGENLTRLINRQILVTDKNIFRKNNLK